MHPYTLTWIYDICENFISIFKATENVRSNKYFIWTSPKTHALYRCLAFIKLIITARKVHWRVRPRLIYCGRLFAAHFLSAKISWTDVDIGNLICGCKLTDSSRVILSDNHDIYDRKLLLISNHESIVRNGPFVIWNSLLIASKWHKPRLECYHRETNKRQSNVFLFARQ